MKHSLNRALSFAYWLMLCVGMAILTVPGAEAKEGKAAVANDARIGVDGNRTRFVADLSSEVGFTAFTLDDPYRVIIDLPAVDFRLPADIGRKGRGLVSAFRYGLFAPGKSRIVIDTTGPVAISRQFVSKAKGKKPARLVLDLIPTTREKFLANRIIAPTTARPRRLRRDEIERLLKSARDKNKKVIVLDPGHGGIDSGAIGYRGTQEKKVILSFGKTLKRHLEKTGKYQVFLTRETDVFIPLRDRVSFAREHEADLFLSIHADSVPKRIARRVRGATVYILSDRASDEEAAKLAQKENRSDIIAGVEIPKSSNVVTGILIDLAQRETNALSSGFANELIGSLGKATRMAKNSYRSAAFVVLKAPDVPSALLELGYVTNPTDEKNLSSRAWREKVARSVVGGIGRFFTRRTALVPY